MNDLDIPEILKVDPKLRGKGSVTTGYASRSGNGEKSYQTFKGRMLPKTMTPEAWEIIHAEDKTRTQLKERFQK